MATAERKGFVNVDELQQQITLETVLDFYGIDAQLKQAAAEVRMACVLNCGKNKPTGDRAIAIQPDGVKRWQCHEYGCGRNGNLVGMCDLLKAGDNADGKPRGQRFKDIAADLQAMAGGAPPPAQPARAAKQPSTPPPAAEPKVNGPLAKMEKPAARALVNLDEKFLVNSDERMNKDGASYIRQRPYLTQEHMQKWRCGYLPKDTGGDNTGGTMRGKFVYGFAGEDGELLTWFGRDPAFEQKFGKWERSGRSADKEPRKHHFVKGFHRGMELYGQHAISDVGTETRDAVRELGVIVVEGPNDVIALDALQVPAVGLCSNQITEDQAAKIGRWANQLGSGTVTLMLDCDAEGANGARRSLYYLAQHSRVRLAWSPMMHGGKFRGRQPESLSLEEWSEIRDALSRGGDSA